MAAPTYSEIWTQARNATWLMHQMLLYTSANAENFLGHEDDLVQSLEGDYAPLAAQGVASLRASLNGALTAGRFTLDPILSEMAQAINSPATSPQAILSDLYDYMVVQG